MKDKYVKNNKIFVFGNGGSAANASHFVTDLGKSSSDAMAGKFKVMSLNDNISWITALGNDYQYSDIFVKQLENYASKDDLVVALSVSGNSPNILAACSWAKENGITTMAFIGGGRSQLSEIADHKILVESTHYGRVEDCQMTICHLLCYAFVELGDLRN